MNQFNIASIEIVCTSGRNEVATVIHHEVPEETRLNDRECDSTTVKIKARRFPVYAACPVSTARKLEQDARRNLPGVPVTVYHA